MSENDRGDGTNPFASPTPTTNPGIPALMPRSRRATQVVSYKTILLLLATVGSMLGIGGTIYAISSGFGAKADKIEVRDLQKDVAGQVKRLEENVVDIRLDVNTIKTEQRMLIDKIAPGMRKAARDEE